MFILYMAKIPCNLTLKMVRVLKSKLMLWKIEFAQHK